MERHQPLGGDQSHPDIRRHLPRVELGRLPLDVEKCLLKHVRVIESAAEAAVEPQADHLLEPVAIGGK